MASPAQPPGNKLIGVDLLDGLGHNHKRIEPRWKEHTWPSAPGLHRSFLRRQRPLAAYRLDRGKEKPGWWTLDGFISVVCGHRKAYVLGTGWVNLPPEEMIKVMAALRMIGADDRLEFVLPPAYREITEASPDDIDRQIRSAMKLAQEQNGDTSHW